MPESNPAAKLSLSFAKLVATPTDIAWSQAYNAGNLFACLSLTTETVDEKLSLQSLGKEIFNVLQSEFFTLQEKNTESIKTAIQKSLENVPIHITTSLTLAFFKETTLFVFIAGSGKVVMKRGEKIGTLLTKKGSYDGESVSASGFMENTDTIVLETGQFAQSIENETIMQALELALPNDIAEALSPQMHKQDDGAQAAIIISYRGASKHWDEINADAGEEEPTLASLYNEEQPTEPIQDEPSYQEEPVHEPHESHHKTRQFSLPKLPFLNLNMSHRRKLFLNIAFIIAALLLLSIFFTIKKYNDEKEHALFQSIYPPAEQYYSAGKGLETVNASLSQDNYHKAENLLKNGKTKIPKGSKDYQKITNLLSQVETVLQGSTTGQQTNATAVSPNNHSLLAIEQTMKDAIAFGQDTNSVYAITDKAITTVSKDDGSTKDIIKNKNSWTSPVAVVPYEGFIYVLDQKHGVLKFVSSANGFDKTSYFKGSTPDLSDATSMAIDGSVWLLFKDGTIMQYTKGVSNNLKISGLVKPLTNPNKIVTDITMENIYVLDPGTSRIVEFDKNGKYQNAFSASVIANAKDFTVSEKDKKAFVLSGGKVWEINL